MENETKTYHTSSGGAIVGLVAAIVMSVVSVLNFQQGRPDNWIPWAYVLLLLVIAADLKFGIYARRRDDYFCETKHFVYWRCIKISNIEKIMYKPTWLIGENMRSIYVVDREGGAIRIRMANGAYPLGTLTQIVTDLVAVNPSIELDAETKELLRKYL
jgi:hypothetical protein